jgi:diguanylate cyclase (GGDEF)-like protein
MNGVMDLGSSGLYDNPLRVGASLAHLVSRERDPDRARALVVEQTGSLLDADLVRLFEPASEGELQFSRSWGSGRLPASAVEMERELLARALKLERSLLSTHPALDPALRDLAVRCARDGSIVHALLIRAQGGTHGAVCVHWLGRARPGFERRVGFYLYWDQIGVAVAGMRERASVERELGRLHRLALRDELTGLPNGRALNEELERWLDGLIPFALLIADFDGMRQANNALGYRSGGDVLIQTFGEALPSLLLDGEFAARLYTAGDEFACVVRAPSEAAAGRRAAELEQELEQLDLPGTHRAFYRGASVGNTLARRDDTAASLLERASESMRQRKRARYEQRRRPSR